MLLPIAAAVVAGSASILDAASIDDVANVVVIYAENRSFDKLYGSFPGARFLTGNVYGRPHTSRHSQLLPSPPAGRG